MLQNANMVQDLHGIILQKSPSIKGCMNASKISTFKLLQTTMQEASRYVIESFSGANDQKLLQYMPEKLLEYWCQGG